MENSFGQNKRAKNKEESLSDINACDTHSLFNFHADSFPLDDIFIPEMTYKSCMPYRHTGFQST